MTSLIAAGVPLIFWVALVINVAVSLTLIIAMIRQLMIGDINRWPWQLVETTCKSAMFTLVAMWLGLVLLAFFSNGSVGTVLNQSHYLALLVMTIGESILVGYFSRFQISSPRGESLVPNLMSSIFARIAIAMTLIGAFWALLLLVFGSESATVIAKIQHPQAVGSLVLAMSCSILIVFFLTLLLNRNWINFRFGSTLR